MATHSSFLTWKIHGVYAVRTSIQVAFLYDDTCRTYSDDNTTRIHYLHSREVRCCDGRYFYLQHEYSVTHTVSVSRFDYLRANESMKKQLIGLNVSSYILDVYENVRWLVLIDLYMFHFQNRKTLSKPALLQGMAEMHRIWETIEVPKISRKYKYKFGYMPMKFSWTAFRIQEELYFSLRKFVGK